MVITKAPILCFSIWNIGELPDVRQYALSYIYIFFLGKHIHTTPHIIIHDRRVLQTFLASKPSGSKSTPSSLEESLEDSELDELA